MSVGIQDTEDSLNAACGLFVECVICNIREEYMRPERVPVNVMTKIALCPPGDTATYRS
jgi:hypothetical protein